LSKGDVQALADRLTSVVNWARNRGITHAEVLGCIELVKLDVYQEIITKDESNGEILPE
jgi:hypothetical protein